MLLPENNLMIEQCIGLDIKSNRENSVSRLCSLTVSGQTIDDGTTYKFNETKTFEYKSSASITFVETDKPVYKPSQTGTLCYKYMWCSHVASCLLLCFIPFNVCLFEFKYVFEYWRLIMH